MSQSATPATQNNMSTSSDTSKKTRLCDFSHRHGNFSLTRVVHLTHVECHKVACHGKWHRKGPKCCACHEKCNTPFWKCSKSIAPATQKRLFDKSWNMLECHEVPRLQRKTPWPQLLTRRKRHVFCDFSHRHGSFSITRVAHLTHVECHKVPRPPRKTTWPHLLTRRKRYVCATLL